MKLSLAAVCGRPVWLGISFALSWVAANAAPTLPEPLTLDAALSLPAATDPTLEQAQADVDLAHAQQQDTQADSGFQAALQGRAFRVAPYAVASDQGRDDNSVSLVVRKPLYDFGRSSAGVAAAQAEVQGSEWRLLDAQQQRRLNIMARFFDVLLADLAKARDDQAFKVNERLYRSAVARQQMGQISRIDLAAQQTAYLATQRQQLASAARGRATRQALADSLDRHGAWPGTLTPPAVPTAPRALPNIAGLLESAQAHNVQLRAQRAQLEAARQRVQAARAQRRPTLNGELAASDYSRQTDERDKWHAGVVLEVPLYAGGKTDAAIAMRQAELRRLEAAYAQAQQSLAQSVQTTLDELANLRLQSEQARAQLDYRRMALERTRGMRDAAPDGAIDADRAALAEARLFRAQTDYQLLLTEARLDALLGQSSDAQPLARDSDDAAAAVPLKN